MSDNILPLPPGFVDDGYPIPESLALREVNYQSSQELFSRDPERITQNEFDVIIMQLRDIRDKLAASETIRQPRVKRETHIGPIIDDPDLVGL